MRFSFLKVAFDVPGERIVLIRAIYRPSAAGDVSCHLGFALCAFHSASLKCCNYNPERIVLHSMQFCGADAFFCMHFTVDGEAWGA